MKTLNVGMIGYKFMGKAHSNAWRQAPHFFDLPAGVYITGILLSVLFIYGLVLICSLYPGRQASAIYPAVALHED